MAAPVARVAVALDQSPVLERVEDADHLAAVDVQRVGDRRLCLAVLLGQQRQDAVVVEARAAALDLLDRPRLERVAEPREQERAVRQQLLCDAGGKSRNLGYLSSHEN